LQGADQAGSAKVVERHRQAGPLSDGATANIFVHAFAAGSVQGILLKSKVLLGC
jgi:hypothetical protein